MFVLFLWLKERFKQSIRKRPKQELVNDLPYVKKLPKSKMRKVGTFWRLNRTSQIVTSTNAKMNFFILDHFSFFLPSYNRITKNIQLNIFFNILRILICGAIGIGCSSSIFFYLNKYDFKIQLFTFRKDLIFHVFLPTVPNFNIMCWIGGKNNR